MDNLSMIRDALAALLVRTNEDAFVIIEHEEAEKFVQFAGAASEMLLLDLPSQTLSELEFYRAVDFFRRIGVRGEEHDQLDEPGGEVYGQQFSFNLTLRSAEEGSRITLDLFETVYELPRDCSLVITEN